MNLINRYFQIILISILIISCAQPSETLKKVLPPKSEEAPNDKKTQSTRTEIYSPEKELAGFKVPDGFVVELVASERDGIVNPIDLTFDDAGNLWTQTAEMYPLDPVANIHWSDLLKLMDNPEAQRENPDFKRIFDLYEGKTKGSDKILVVSDLYKKTPAKVTVWADGLTIPQSILPYKNGAYVAQGSELFLLNDTNNDGKADERTRVFTGFGVTDTHTMVHVLKRAPGDWIHFSHGALNKGKVTSFFSDASINLDYCKNGRFSLDGKKIELVNSGLNNIWGFQLRGNGQWYGTEANDFGFSIVPMEVGTGYQGIGSERLRPYQPWMLVNHKFRVGATGISGLAFADDPSGSFPEEWKDVALLANPITSTINAVRIVRNPDGTITATHLEDLLSSEDDWFRPVNMEFGPDGCLYIADWYNKIISHNELPTTHPDRDKKHGRIWRIRHKSQKPRKIKDFTKLPSKDLVAELKSPSLWAKRAAWHQITDRPSEETKSLTDGIVKIAANNSFDEITRILALWSLEGIQHYDSQLMVDLLASSDDNLRREAIRSLVSFSLSPSEIASLLTQVQNDPNVMVRSQVLRTLSEIGSADQSTIAILVNACKPDIKGNQLGSSYERKFERYLARKALENYPDQLQTYLESSDAKNHEVSNLIWASQVLAQDVRESKLLEYWPLTGYEKLDEPTFIIVAKMLDNPAIYKAVKPVIQSNEYADIHVNWAIKNQGQVQSEKLSTLLEVPVIYLLNQPEESKVKLGLDATGKLSIRNTRDKVASIIETNDSPKILDLAMKALASKPKENREVFYQLSKNESLSFEVRLSALHSLAKSDANRSLTMLHALIPNLTDEQTKTLVKKFSGSKEGISVLKKLYKKNLVQTSSIDISSAERIYNADKTDPLALKILEGVKKIKKQEKLAFEAKLYKFMEIAEKGGGNAAKGEELFQVCLMCHRVGDEGFDLAPVLDGSGTRENEALLTAILDPDAALESSYAVYRVTKKDGSNVEGYLLKTEEKGTTLAFMGGSETFIENKDIQSQGHLGGRSFMLKGLLDNYSEEQVADLLAYIKTIK